MLSVRRLRLPVSSGLVCDGRLDRCVGGANQRAFVAGLAAVSGALLWAAYLTLTSVCYCRTLVGTWQLPVSCNVRSNG